MVCNASKSAAQNKIPKGENTGESPKYRQGKGVVNNYCAYTDEMDPVVVPVHQSRERDGGVKEKVVRSYTVLVVQVPSGFVT